VILRNWRLIPVVLAFCLTLCAFIPGVSPDAAFAMVWIGIALQGIMWCAFKLEERYLIAKARRLQADRLNKLRGFMQ
jgi:hypothetical protein